MLRHIRSSQRVKTLAAIISLISLLSFILFNCAQTSKFLNSANVFPDSEDIKLGAQIDEEIRKNPAEYPIMQGHPEIKAYIEQVGNKVLASPEVKKRGVYAYKYEVINDDKTVNAFCTPGGYIYVYTGLLKFIDNEATLAGVLGHEIAHAERRHSTKRMTKAYGAQFVLALVLGEKPGQIAAVTANLFTGLALLANGRGDETEADEYSLKYLSTTEYYPGAVTYFFEKILQQQGGGGGGGLEKFLSTHPLPQDRVAHIKELMAGMGNPQPSESNVFADRFASMKKQLP